MGLSRSTVLVTGADGFAGHNLCRHLIELGADVRAVVQPGPTKNISPQAGMEIVTGDVTDYQSILNAMKDADIIFHLSALTLIPETRAVIGNTFSVNSTGTLNVLMAAKELSVDKVLYTSTCHVYGNQSSFPIEETAIPVPIDIYSASKLAAEHLCTAFVEMFGLDVTISRAFNHFGPGQRGEFLIPTVVSKLLGKQSLQLGNPRPTRDYTYVEDIIRGYVALADKGKSGEIYHLCSGKERTIQQIVDKIIEISDSDLQVSWDPEARRVDIPRSVGSFQKVTKELGWEPRISFEEGIRRTIESYLSEA